MKVRVKILDSIAGLADPNTAALDKKYEGITEGLKAREKPPTDRQIKDHIDSLKKADRYADVQRGFKKDWSFKPGDEALIEEATAKQWADSEICTILPNESKKVA